MVCKRSKSPRVLKGQVADFISREEFRRRFENNFFDPAFDGARDAVRKLETIAWNGYKEARKSPRTQKAGRGFANSDYDLSIEWKTTRDRLLRVDARRKSAKSTSRVLVICGSPRNDGTCPGEMSKTFRLAKVAQRTLEREKIDVDLLDLSRVDNEYELKIHPCKGCVSPNHLAGRAYGLVVLGDVAGTESVRRAMTDWLNWMGLIEAGDKSRLDRYVGYYKPYATSHQELDEDRALVEEVRMWRAPSRLLSGRSAPASCGRQMLGSNALGRSSRREQRYGSFPRK